MILLKALLAKNKVPEKKCKSSPSAPT